MFASLALWVHYPGAVASVWFEDHPQEPSEEVVKDQTSELHSRNTRQTL